MSENYRPEDIDQIVETLGRERSTVIPILQRIQEQFHYLPEEALRRVCEITDITPADIAGISSFYSQFRHRPAGHHTIKICVGTACHVKGAETIHNGFKHCLHIPEEEDTDTDRIFTVEKVACLGCCMLAPAVQIDDITYGFVSLQDIPNILRDFLHSQKHTTEPHAHDAPTRTSQGEIRSCVCSSCAAAGSPEVLDMFRREIKTMDIPVTIRTVGCTGISYEAPLIHVVLPSGKQFEYGRVRSQDARGILLRHFTSTSLSSRLRTTITNLLETLLTDEAWGKPVTRYATPFRETPTPGYKDRQVHLVMKHCGEMDPLDLSDYQRHDGFKALDQCQATLSPDAIIGLIRESGLRGRGGAGFDTARKWDTVRRQTTTPKYIICNGDEGDPGAFMDRMILESFPFRVLEGMAIAALAIGAKEGFLYVRAEYPLAIKRLRDALGLCSAQHLLPVKLSIIEGAGAFVCGEETALIAAIEGRRGMPRFRPPYPAESGFKDCPTLINNVETFSVVPEIILCGPDAFRKIGTETSKGTKAFALAGKVNRGGLIEVPMGLTLREIVNEIGGGVQNDRHVKAVQIGGPSGGCVPESELDIAVDYNALIQVGAMMGSGGLVVLDDTDCMVDIARYFLQFTQDQSCGKCTFCRVGTKRMLEILDRLCAGKGQQGDCEALEHLATSIKAGSLCGLGSTAPNPVLSTLRYFREEYEAHIQGRCPAHKCTALISYKVNHDCIGCTKCAQRCPVDAIEARPYEQQEIDDETCTRCDTCRQICPMHAIDLVDSIPDGSGQRLAVSTEN